MPRFTLAIQLIAFSFTLAAGVAAQTVAPESRFEASPSEAEFVPAITPGQHRLTVMLKLAGDGVAAAQAKSAQPLSPAAKDAIRGDLRARQEGLRASIEANGAVVLGQYQDAVNGIKVDTPVERLSALSTLLNVVGVKPVATYELDNSVSVPFIGAPQVWAGVAGLHGENIKVAIIDTGIDYTHANFGGPGDPAAYVAAHAAETAPADPRWFGPDAPKVKGGIDLAGDLYSAGSSDPARRVPHPDPNPLDCNGHGTHVAGTAAGFGVTAAGATYRGAYASGLSGMRIGPGVAPLADLYAVRVFGCEGSTNLTVDAIDWAVANGMQVINMSLGSSFGSEDDASAEAASNAADSGVVVVASAGNSGATPYITGAPATGNGAISVAAVDSTATFPGATVTLANGASITALNANAATLPAQALSVYVLRNADGSVSLGCKEAEYVDAAIAGKLVVTQRGTCARVDRPTFGGRHGAAAVAMINDSASYPPFEGDIAGVTIPFLGIRSGDGAALIGSSTATLAATKISNPGFGAFASFTSGGPRQDGFLKPDVSAPGVSIASSAVGSGAAAVRLSGTSMAAPHVAGVAALALQAHPSWDPRDVALAVVNTADPSQIARYNTRLGGAGLVQPYAATRTSVIASAGDGFAVNFGKEQFDDAFQDAREIKLRNRGSTAATFEVSVTAAGSPRSITVSPTTVTVPAGDEAQVLVSLTVAAATVGDANAFRDVRGFVSFSPATADTNAGVGLTVPLYFVPRGRSLAAARLASTLSVSSPNSTARVSNEGAVKATADFYAWGLSDARKNLGAIDLRAVGVQSFEFRSTRLLVFAVNTFRPWTAPSKVYFELDLDTTGSGKPNFAVVGADIGLLTTGRFDGRIAVAVFNLATGKGRIRFLAVAPQDGSTMLLPLLASDLGLTAAAPRFTYTAYSEELFTGAFKNMAGSAKFNAWSSAISQGDFASVPAGGSVSVPVSIDAAEWASTPALGSMIVTLDNYAGARQAMLLRAR